METHSFVLKEITMHFPVLVNKLQCFSMDLCMSKAKPALKLLNYLLLDCSHNEQLIDAFFLLDSFPDIPQFHKLNNRLNAVKSTVGRSEIPNVSNFTFVVELFSKFYCRNNFILFHLLKS